MNRRTLIRGIGAALVAGVSPPFIPSLLTGDSPLQIVGVDWVPELPKATIHQFFLQSIGGKFHMTMTPPVTRHPWPSTTSNAKRRIDTVEKAPSAFHTITELTRP